MANECIPLYDPNGDVSALTTAAVTGKRFVELSADTLNATTGALASVAHATAAGPAFGVAAYDAAISTRVPVIRRKGIAIPVAAGGTIAYGAFVEVGAAGKAVTFSAGVKVARALQAGTNNNDVIVELI